LLFTATDDGRKLPRSKAGPGVSMETNKADLYTPDEVRAHDRLADNNYWGLYMHEPLTDMFDSAVLTVLDVDLKRSTSTTDMRIQRLAKWAKDHGHMAERSHSKKGRHVLFLAKPSTDILPKYKLQDHQEIEVFGQPNSPKKSLMLTGDMLTKDAINNQDVDVAALIQELGIQVEPEQKNPSPYFWSTTRHSRTTCQRPRPRCATSRRTWITPSGYSSARRCTTGSVTKATT